MGSEHLRPTHEHGPAAALLGAAWPVDPTVRSLRFLVPDEPAVVVLGSSEADPRTGSPGLPGGAVGRGLAGVHDGEANGALAKEKIGAHIVRRRSGGGAVWLDDGVVWADLWVPVSDPRWDPDVGRGTHWVGRRIADALALTGLVVHTAAMVSPPGARVVCWLGLGHGEVHDGRGAKVVGIAQRRTARGALFQIGVLRVTSQWKVLAALGVDSAVATQERVRAAELPCGLDRATIEERLGTLLVP